MRQLAKKVFSLSSLIKTAEGKATTKHAADALSGININDVKEEESKCNINEPKKISFASSSSPQP